MRASFLLLALLAAAGCDRGKVVDERNASVGEVVNAVREAKPDMKLNPGRWETTMSFVEFDAPGMPPQALDMMKNTLGKERTFASCLTKEEAEKPAEDFFAEDKGSCKYDHFTMGGGKIDAVMKCGKGDTMATLTYAGSYAPDSYEATVSNRIDRGGQGAMTMKMAMKSRNVGPCKGDEKN